jgi:hypothetical protein
MSRHPRLVDRDAERRRLAALAAEGLSQAQAARALGLTRNAVVGRARDFEIRFQGSPFIGGGCNPEQARRGWQTRRARQQAQEGPRA